jgi:hypothetical protein
MVKRFELAKQAHDEYAKLFPEEVKRIQELTQDSVQKMYPRTGGIGSCVGYPQELQELINLESDCAYWVGIRTEQLERQWVTDSLKALKDPSAGKINMNQYFTVDLTEGGADILSKVGRLGQFKAGDKFTAPLWALFGYFGQSQGLSKEMFCKAGELEIKK